MFWRILWRLLYASRGRLALALIAVASGAAVSAALLNLDLDAGDKLTREFRVLGANVIVSPVQGDEEATTMDATKMDRIDALHEPNVVAAAPYLYVVAQAEPAARTSEKSKIIPVVVAGTWLDRASGLNSWWKVDGQWMTIRGDGSQCMVGRQAAAALGVRPGNQLILQYSGRQVPLTVAGVVTAGGSEDSQVFVDLSVAQDLAALGGRIGLVQLSVRGSAAVIEGVIDRLKDVLPGLEVAPVRQLAVAEGRLLDRIRGLLFATVLLILLLTALSVLAVMAGLALERRQDVGLMKALGGPVRRVMRFFLAEATVVGVVGGVIGCGVGMLLSEWIGERVFETSIEPRLIVLPVVLGLMIGVSWAGALPLRLLGRIRPAEILRSE